MNTTNVRSWYEPQQKWKMQSVRWSFLLQPRKTTLRTALRIVHTMASDLRPSDSSNWISYKKGIKDYIYHGSKKESFWHPLLLLSSSRNAIFNQTTKNSTSYAMYNILSMPSMPEFVINLPFIFNSSVTDYLLFLSSTPYLLILGDRSHLILIIEWSLSMYYNVLCEYTATLELLSTLLVNVERVLLSFLRQIMEQQWSVHSGRKLLVRTGREEM